MKRLSGIPLSLTLSREGRGEILLNRPLQSTNLDGQLDPQFVELVLNDVCGRSVLRDHSLLLLAMCE